MKLDAGYSVQRRPPFESLGFQEHGIVYPMTEVAPREIPRPRRPEDEVHGYPVYWCALGKDWIRVYPTPHRDLEVVGW